jgi:hypothetical protein
VSGGAAQPVALPAAASGRLVRSFLRYLRERAGEAACQAIGRELGGAPGALVATPPLSTDWIPLATWLPVLAAFERRFGDPATWQLLRETTRATMAVAMQKGWSRFMADITPDLLAERAGTFWQMSYDTGMLVVRARGPRRCRLAIENWRDPPAPVVASVAEACVVFLVRLGERSGRAVETIADGCAELEVSW